MPKPASLRRAEHEISPVCPIETALGFIDGKWKVLIILRLMVRMRRFNELLRSLGGCSQRTLTKQLRELESDGLIHREVFAEVPPRVEYSVTAKGRALHPVLKAICEWGQVNILQREPDFEQAFREAP